MKLTGDIGKEARLEGKLTAVKSIDGKLSPVATLSAELTAEKSLAGTLSSEKSLTGKLTIPDDKAVTDYDGPYQFTPTLEEQTISIDHKTAAHDIIINPIPSNYGLITWDGQKLIVS